MLNRHTMMRTALAAALTLALIAPGFASAREMFRLAHSGGPSDDFTYGAEQFAASLAKISGGEAEVKVMGNAVLGNDRVTTKMCQQGSLDFSLTGQAQTNLFVGTMAALDLPYIVDPARNTQFMESFLPGGKLYEYIDSAFMKAGLKLVCIMDTPFRSYAFAPRAGVTNLESAKGAKVRVTLSPVERAFANALGMNPSSIAWPEVYTAVQQGTVDGEIISPATIVANSRLEVENTFLQTEHNTAKMFVLMSKIRWDKCSPEMQKQILDAGTEAARLEWAKCVELNTAAVEACKAGGMNFIILSDAEKVRLQELIAPVYRQFEAEFDPAFLQLIKEAQQ